MKKLLTCLFLLYFSKSIAQITYEVGEQLTDSLLIAKGGQYKINLQQLHYSNDSVRYIISLYKKELNRWMQVQTYSAQKDNITPLDPIIADFTNDGYNDLLIRSKIAARSANAVYTLFVFNKNTEQLVPIKNSEDYPNMRYNKKLNCIDAWLVYGGSSTVFLKLVGDSLKEFAGVENYDGLRTVYLVDSLGKQKNIQTDSIKDMDVYQRYINYKPLLKCKEE